MTFATFDAAYVAHLRDGDSATEAHFTRYFGDLLFLKLRHRLRSVQLVEDIRQETLLRVIRTIRADGLEHPERLGAYVNTVSNYVMMEMLRSEGRHPLLEPDAPEPRDSRVDLDAPLIDRERREQVAQVLAALPAKDQTLLRMIFLEEVDKDEICSRLHVDGDYLRVLLHRAKARFRSEFLQRAAAARKAC